MRFRQSIEKFYYEILVINYKVQLLGLVEINLGLLHDVSIKLFAIFSLSSVNNLFYFSFPSTRCCLLSLVSC